jgi:glycosyltransferase involved in cell wall biosynthesis
VNRILVAIPAYNERETIRSVVNGVRQHLPTLDLLVVDDGSRDGMGQILRDLHVMTATHLCNLGYGRAIQTAIKYALAEGYDALITLDGDGQHDAGQIPGMVARFRSEEWDVLVGSRYVQSRDYTGAPLGRRIGMQLFSVLTRILTGQRVYDTSSGLKIMRRCVFEPLTRWHLLDFHAEAIVYLMRMGYRVGEYPIGVGERKHGQSMYSALSHLAYPLKTLLMILLGLVEAGMVRRRMRK